MSLPARSAVQGAAGTPPTPPLPPTIPPYPPPKAPLPHPYPTPNPQVVTLHNQRDFIFFRQHRYRISTAEHPAHPYLDPHHPLSRHVSPLRSHRNPSYPTSPYSPLPPTYLSPPNPPRYVFEQPEDKGEVKVRLQELGPRFTLKLKSLQLGTFDTQHGEYEWKHKPELDTSRRRFHV